VPLEQIPVADSEEVTGYENELLDRDPDYGIDPGFARVEEASRPAAVRAFVRALPDNQRTITEDVFWSERTHRDIAAERGISRPAVTRTLQRVFARGRRELAELAPELAA
jgi:DNA-directed RNA polymerase specialized sigma24 family protein